MSVVNLDDFAGTWNLSREITDARTGAVSVFKGEAVFSPETGGLAYVETGQLRLPGAPPMRAERRYHWGREGQLIAVAFSDGRHFHVFDPSLPCPEAEHSCAPDHYAVRYDLTEWPRWQAQWRVVGPRKDYTMVSRYTR